MTPSLVSPPPSGFRSLSSITPLASSGLPTSNAAPKVAPSNHDRFMPAHTLSDRSYKKAGGVTGVHRDQHKAHKTPASPNPKHDPRRSDAVSNPSVLRSPTSSNVELGMEDARGERISTKKVKQRKGKERRKLVQAVEHEMDEEIEDMRVGSRMANVAMAKTKMSSSQAGGRSGLPSSGSTGEWEAEEEREREHEHEHAEEDEEFDEEEPSEDISLEDTDVESDQDVPNPLPPKIRLSNLASRRNVAKHNSTETIGALNPDDGLRPSDLRRSSSEPPFSIHDPDRNGPPREEARYIHPKMMTLDRVLSNIDENGFEYVDESDINAGFICSICSSPFTHPVKTPCQHHFCCTCILDWFRAQGEAAAEAAAAQAARFLMGPQSRLSYDPISGEIPRGITMTSSLALREHALGGDGGSRRSSAATLSRTGSSNTNNIKAPTARSKDDMGTCPVCRTKFDVNDLDLGAPVRIDGRDVRDLPVRCPLHPISNLSQARSSVGAVDYTIVGCRFAGSRKEVLKHVRYDCPFVLVSCTFAKCGKEIPRGDLTNHESECEHGWVYCGQCDRPFQVEARTHHMKRCPKRLEKCTFCQGAVQYDELEMHSRQCEHKPVDCFNAGYGCDFRAKAADHMKHLESDCRFEKPRPFLEACARKLGKKWVDDPQVKLVVAEEMAELTRHILDSLDLQESGHSTTRQTPESSSPLNPARKDTPVSSTRATSTAGPLSRSFNTVQQPSALLRTGARAPTQELTGINGSDGPFSSPVTSTATSLLPLALERNFGYQGRERSTSFSLTNLDSTFGSEMGLGQDNSFNGLNDYGHTSFALTSSDFKSGSHLDRFTATSGEKIIHPSTLGRGLSHREEFYGLSFQ